MARSTPFPTLEVLVERWQWPLPPFAWRHLPAPDMDAAQPCRIEMPRGVSVEGEMLGMDPAARGLTFRISSQGPSTLVPFKRVRRLTLTTPLAPAPRLAGAPEERVPAAAQEREYRLLATDNGEPLIGRTAGHVERDEGLYLFTPVDEERSLQRAFVPQSAYAQYEFGPSAEEVAAERWIGTPRELLLALDQQQRMPVIRLGQALLNLGLLTHDQLERALAQQQGTVPLGEALVATGVISRSDLRTALAHKMGYPVVDLTRFPIDVAAVRMLPLKMATDCIAVPLMIHAGRLIVAVDRPSRATRLGNLRAVAELKIVPVLASKSQLIVALGDLVQQDVWSNNVFAKLVFAPTTV